MKKFDVGGIGKRFGRLVVTERAGSNRHKKALVACICDCGNKIVAVLSNVKNKWVKENLSKGAKYEN